MIPLTDVLKCFKFRVAIVSNCSVTQDIFQDFFFCFHNVTVNYSLIKIIFEGTYDPYNLRANFNFYWRALGINWLCWQTITVMLKLICSGYQIIQSFTLEKEKVDKKFSHTNFAWCLQTFWEKNFDLLKKLLWSIFELIYTFEFALVGPNFT